MSWELRVPFRSRDDRLDLGEVHDLVHEVISDPEEQRVTWELLFDLATTPGARTYGDVLDRLEQAGPAGRRQLLDKARGAVGLGTVAAAEADRNSERENRLQYPVWSRRRGASFPRLCGAVLLGICSRRPGRADRGSG